MADQGEMTPAVWDPTARGGAGGWVRRPAAPPAADAPARPMAAPPQPGAVGDQGPPLAARPYLSSAPMAAPDRQGPPPPPPLPPRQPSMPPGPAPAPGGYGYPQQVVTGPVRPQQPPQPAPAPTSAPFEAAPPPYDPARPYSPQGGFAPQGSYPAPERIELPNRYEEFDQFREAKPSRRTPLLLGIGLLVLLAIGGGSYLALQTSGSPKASAAPPPTAAPQSAAAPAPNSAPASADPSSAASASASGSAGPNAQSQAKALDDLLGRGESAKAPIGSAVAKVESCPAKADIDSAAATFDSGAAQRDQLITDLAALNLADLPGGADAAATLKSAWQQSGDIDRAYAAWARTVSAQGCGGGKTAPSTPDKQHADDLNPQATQSKKDFVGKWNAIASSYGLTARTWDRI